MRFVPRPGPQAEQRSGTHQPTPRADVRRFFGFWRGGDTDAEMRSVATRRQNRVSKGAPFGTRPCLQGVVCLYLLVRLPGKAGAVRFAPRFPRQENGRGFVTGREQKLSVFRERQQVYKVPTCKRKQQYYLFIIFPTFLIEIDIVPFGLFINSMYSELSKKSEGIVISIPVSVLILCFLPSRMA